MGLLCACLHFPFFFSSLPDLLKTGEDCLPPLHPSYTSPFASSRWCLLLVLHADPSPAPLQRPEGGGIQHLYHYNVASSFARGETAFEPLTFLFPYKCFQCWVWIYRFLACFDRPSYGFAACWTLDELRAVGSLCRIVSIIFFYFFFIVVIFFIIIWKMESNIFTPILENFMSSPLVSWVSSPLFSFRLGRSWRGGGGRSRIHVLLCR